MRAQVVRDLLRLNVVTEFGQFLGRVSDVEIEPDSATVRAYLVSPSFVKGLFSTEQYFITPQQVISITAEKMVVQEGVISEKEGERSLLPNKNMHHKPMPLTRQTGE